MNFLKSGWFKFIIFILVIFVIATIFYFKPKEPVNYRTATVSSGDIESYVEGSGAIGASEARKVYAKVSAEIIEVLHKEGETVNSGDVIMRLDSSSYEATVNSQKIAIEQANLSVNNIKKQIRDLTIVANATGYVSELAISEGSYLSNTMPVCNILESDTYEIVLPFVYSEANKIPIGSTAKITLVQNFSELQGVVTKVSEMRKLAEASSQVVDVTIKVPTSGYSLTGAIAKGEILVNGTKQASTATASFLPVSLNTVRALTMGTVKTLNVYDGKFVNKGDVIAVLTNDDLNTSLENANLTLKNLKSQYSSVIDMLDNYTIKAPISGVITAQSLDVGDMIPAGTILTTVSNSDVFEFMIPVDELDIAKLSYDKDVNVTIDAISETTANPIKGKISKLPLEGVSNAGVTEYYVTIQIPGSENVRISMNANAKIIVSSKKDVLVLPVDAVTKEDGKSKVIVLNDDGTTEERVVEVGDRNVSYIEIKGGLNAGENVVIPDVEQGFGIF